MTAITLEQIQAKQSELASMIAQLLTPAAQTTTIQIEADSIELAPGERYAGSVLDADGQHRHHLVLMAARAENDMTWRAAMEWAEAEGGALPLRQEQALLFANCKPHLKAGSGTGPAKSMKTTRPAPGVATSTTAARATPSRATKVAPWLSAEFEPSVLQSFFLS